MVAAFTVSELLIDNQQGEGKITPPPAQIRVNKAMYICLVFYSYFLHYIHFLFSFNLSTLIYKYFISLSSKLNRSGSFAYTKHSNQVKISQHFRF